MTPKELYDWIKASIKEDVGKYGLSDETPKDDYYEIFIASNHALELMKSYQKKDIDALVKRAVCSTIDRLDWGEKVKNYVSRQYAMTHIRPIAEDLKARMTKNTFSISEMADYLDTQLGTLHPDIQKEFREKCRGDDLTSKEILESLVVYIWGKQGD